MERPRTLIERSRQLRREATMPEKLLWRHLRGEQLGGFKFRRQHAVFGHILDFACPSVKVGVEIDGLSHDAARMAADERKEAVLQSAGWLVLRFANKEVTNHLESVLTNILRVCEERRPPP